MARKNPIIENLKEELRIAKRERENERELKLRAQGKLEKYEEAEEHENRMVRDMRNREHEYTQRLESDVAWMRRLVEFLTVPADKMQILEEMKNKIEISGDPGFPRRNY